MSASKDDILERLLVSSMNISHLENANSELISKYFSTENEQPSFQPLPLVNEELFPAVPLTCTILPRVFYEPKHALIKFLPSP